MGKLTTSRVAQLGGVNLGTMPGIITQSPANASRVSSVLPGNSATVAIHQTLRNWASRSMRLASFWRYVSNHDKNAQISALAQRRRLRTPTLKAKPLPRWKSVLRGLIEQCEHCASDEWPILTSLDRESLV
jgi:hypothetical protein